MIIDFFYILFVLNLSFFIVFCKYIKIFPGERNKEKIDDKFYNVLNLCYLEKKNPSRSLYPYLKRDIFFK